MTDQLYTFNNFNSDKLMIAKALSKGQFQEAKDFLNVINLAVVDYNQTIYQQTSGMLFVLEILYPDKKYKTVSE